MNLKSELYSAQITRNNPSALIFMVDQSGSMAEDIRYGNQVISKAEAVARTLNITMTEVLARCKRPEGYYNYFDIFMLGYSGDSVYELISHDNTDNGFTTINDLASLEVSSIIYKNRHKTNDGSFVETNLKVNNWIKPLACDVTPMYMALNTVYKTVSSWTRRNKDKNCFPPIVINITDGEASDATAEQLLDISDKIKRLSTSNGNVLLFNLHLSGAAENHSLIFPSSIGEVSAYGRYAELLFGMSSVLPDMFLEHIAQVANQNIEQIRGMRAMSFNSGVVDMLKVITIGSSSINLIK